MKLFRKRVNKTYCINLDQRTDRWEKVTEEFNKVGISPERVSAVSGYEMEDHTPGRIKNKFQKAALQSHKSVLKNIIEHNDSGYYTIFEDDVILHENFENLVDSKIRHLPEDFDILYLGASYGYRDPSEFEEYSEGLVHADSVYGAFAYVITKRSAEKILSHIEESTIAPYDVFLKEFQWENNCYVSSPRIVFCFEGFSDIQQEYKNYSKFLGNGDKHI